VAALAKKPELATTAGRGQHCDYCVCHTAIRSPLSLARRGKWWIRRLAKERTQVLWAIR
jgi:hypothetical protein